MSMKEKLAGHYDSLKRKHDQLDSKIKDMYNHYNSDQELTDLKLKKLRLKEEMNMIEQQLGTQNAET